MTSTLKILSAALFAAGLFNLAHAVPVVIDFSETASQLRALSATGPSDINFKDVITDQYARKGLRFTPNNLVARSRVDDAEGLFNFGQPQAGHGPNFLVNNPIAASFSINLLDGFSLSSMELDYAASSNPFSIKTYTKTGTEATLAEDLFGTSSIWLFNQQFLGLSPDVRRIEFNSGGRVAIDFLRLEITNSNVNLPEPAALGLVGLALAAVGLTRRRKA